jgi:competence protein ComEC
MAAAMALWMGTTRPDLLVAGSGGLVGVMTEEGRALSKPRGDGFTADSWLENDGDRVAQEEAHARAGFAGEPGALSFPLGAGTAVHLSGRGAAARVAEACAAADLVILAAKAEAPAGCRLIDGTSLARTGTLALYAEGADFHIVTVRDWIGRRPWNDQ